LPSISPTSALHRSRIPPTAPQAVERLFRPSVFLLDRRASTCDTTFFHLSKGRPFPSASCYALVFIELAQSSSRYSPSRPFFFIFLQPELVPAPSISKASRRPSLKTDRVRPLGSISRQPSLPAFDPRYRVFRSQSILFGLPETFPKHLIRVPPLTGPALSYDVPFPELGSMQCWLSLLRMWCLRRIRPRPVAEIGLLFRQVPRPVFPCRTTQKVLVFGTYFPFFITIFASTLSLILAHCSPVPSSLSCRTVRLYVSGQRHPFPFFLYIQPSGCLFSVLQCPLNTCAHPFFPGPMKSPSDFSLAVLVSPPSTQRYAGPPTSPDARTPPRPVLPRGPLLLHSCFCFRLETRVIVLLSVS